MKKLKVFIGYDSKEKIASTICNFSLKKNTTIPISVNYLKINQLRKKKIYKRKNDPKSSTEFTFSRFLVPYLSNFKGWSIFCDCDFLWMGDLKDLQKKFNRKYAVMCVKHDYKPNKNFKFDNKRQYVYPRKNWSSMVIWNNEHLSNKKLTLKMINTKDGTFLHRFGWLKDEEIGSVPYNWNWLAGYYKVKSNNKPKAIHYTDGGPWHKGYENKELSDKWKRYHKLYLRNNKK
jgi:hypothetical protein